MQKIISLSILIPAYNDEKTIRDVVKDAYLVGKKISQKLEIIIINDASQDETKTSFARGRLAKLKIITHKKNGGYGRTIKELYYSESVSRRN